MVLKIQKGNFVIFKGFKCVLLYIKKKDNFFFLIRFELLNWIFLNFDKWF